jgi:hypothetical protein
MPRAVRFTAPSIRGAMVTLLDSERPAPTVEDLVREAGSMGITLPPERAEAIRASVTSLLQRLARMSTELIPAEVPIAERRAV